MYPTGARMFPGEGRDDTLAHSTTLKEEKGLEAVPKADQGWGQDTDGPWRVSL